MAPIGSMSEMSQETLSQIIEATRNSMGQSVYTNPALAKANTTAGITQATGLVWYDLQTPAKNLFPVITPLVNMIPRRSGNGGTATNWRAVTGINVLSLQGFVPEGVRDGYSSTTENDYSASYKTMGAENYVTFEAVNAAVNFENIRSTTAQRLLWDAMIRQEQAFIGGNYSIALGTVGTVTAAAATGGSVANGTYNVICVALSQSGLSAASLSGGIPTLVTVTPADGSANFTFGGGSSMKSAATAVTTTTGNNTITASVTPVAGAFGYAWFVGTAGNEVITAITTVSSASISSLAGAGTQNASAVTTDRSTNAYAYDGLLAQALKSGSNAYTKALSAKLTTDSAGGITEINTMLKDRWDNYRLSFDHLFVNSQEMDTIRQLVIKNNGAPLIRFAGDLNQPAMGLIGGAVVGQYVNPFTMGGGQLIKIHLHPNVPAGCVLGVTETLPYPVNNVPNIFEYIYRQDWYQLEWPMRTRRYETGVYTDGVLAHYFPPSMGVIYNITAGI